MASVNDEGQAPTSNGINGHPSPTPAALDAKTDRDSSQKSPVLNEKTLESSHLQNKDAFDANRAIADEAPEETSKPDASTTESKPALSEPSKPTTEVQLPTDDTPMSDASGAPEPEPETDLPEAKNADETSAKEEPSERIASADDNAKVDDISMEESREEAPAKADKADTTSAEAAPAADVEMTGASDVADDSTTAPQPETQATDPAGGDAPSMSNLAISETQDPPSAPATADTSMAEAPSQPAKLAREREEDDVEEPLAKRAKTEDAQAEESVSVSVKPVEAEIEAAPVVEPSAAAEADDKTIPPRTRQWQPGTMSDPASESLPVSPYVNRQMRDILSAVKKTKAGHNFKDSVQKGFPHLWDSYSVKIAKPMDIGLMERNLRESQYQSIGELVNDAFLLYENAVSFNGKSHDVTMQGKYLIDNIFGRMSTRSALEPAKPEKKESNKSASTRNTEPRAATQRRESRGTAPAAAAPAAPAAPLQEVVVDTSPATVAFPAGGTPIIRRDSTKVDNERPKRPVQPPKNRDLPYEVKNSKKKKAQPEMRFCEEVLRELTKARHHDFNQWFVQPVDPVAMGLPTYHKVIKKPMDLETMANKLRTGEYNHPKEFESDFQLIIKNCYKFNGEPVDQTGVSGCAQKLQNLFSQKWKEKDEWVAAHAPTPAPASASSPGDAAEDSDDEAEGSEPEAEIEAAPVSSATLSNLTARLQEENQRFAQLLGAKIPDATLINTQQTMITLITSQIISEKTRLAEEEKKTKKPSKPKPKPSKKSGGAAPAPARKAGGSGGAKKGGAAGGRKGTKARVMGQAEKGIVSESINELEGAALDKAIDIIKKDTHQEESESGELELDIDQLSQDALGRIYDLVLKSLPKLRARVEKAKPPLPSPPAAAADVAVKSSKPKKHKPMGKAEQERNIEKLREIKAAFQRTGSGSQEPIPSVEGGQPAREDDEDSEADSEEE